MTDALWNLVGAGLMLPAIYYAWQVHAHFREHRQVSLALFFLSQRSFPAIRLLFAAGAVYTTGIVLEAIEVAAGTAIPFNLDQALKRAALLGLILFLRAVAQITEKRRAPLS